MSQCYYEDVYFSITFSVDELVRFSDKGKVYFYIASYNKDYGQTSYRPLSVSSVTGNSDYIDVDTSKLNGTTYFVAGEAHWRNSNDTRFKNQFFGCTRQISPNDKFGSNSWCGSNYDERYQNSKYYLFKDNNSLIKNTSNVGVNGTNFLNYTKSPGLYAFCVNTSNRQDGCGMSSEELKKNNYFCNKCSSGSKVLYAYTSYMEINGDNHLSIIIKNPKLCDVTDPDGVNNPLECNSSKEFKSECQTLSVVTNVGMADVQIKQTGTISSVLTPDKIYSGGGFNFGIIYQNNIKWSYVGSQPGTELHKAVNNAMNKKIKDYNSYIAGITLSNLKFDNKIISDDMVKKCFSSSDTKNYYGDDGLTVSCVFTFPSSTISYDGKVSYNSNSLININNKYYTPNDYSGMYSITADISGMDRITAESAVSDSRNGQAWTGEWSDTFTNCNIELYPLLPISNISVNNFIYRPIDINNPFPNRNAGINWYDWIAVKKNRDRLENTYNNLEYTATINNNSISKIKDYNKNNNYLDWSSISSSGKSNFIDDYDFIKREGGS